MPGRKRAAVSKPSSATTAKRGRKTAAEKAFDSAVETLKSAASSSTKPSQQSTKKRSVDKNCSLASNSQASVVDDYDCMLNQTNIGHNNNKYYVIQMISVGEKLYVYNRWGRVGESGQDALFGPYTQKDKAIVNFEKKFKDKTVNEWKNRDKFVPKTGKYTLLDMAGDDDEPEQAPSTTVTVGVGVRGSGAVTKQQSRLDKETQDLVSLIFSKDMFNDQLKNFKIDVKKMPLGKLSKNQIAKGFECLEEIEKVINSGKATGLTELSSKFYTLIPHDFGRTVPPVIKTAEVVREKKDMLLVLADIEATQAMQKDKASGGVKHPLDEQYEMLDCELSRLDHNTEDFKLLKKYTEATHGRGKLLNIWKVVRKSEGNRFASHKGETNRKLLWHGTNIAVVAAILKSGLRIMPHSGGRLGRGIYFASEQAKSSGYVSPDCSSGRGVMFLNEVVLGKEFSRTQGDGSLTQPPSGYHSIVGRGQQEPDTKADTKIKIEGNAVVVPQAKPVKISQWQSSSFWQSEYLIYKESQCRIRYLLEFSFK